MAELASNPESTDKRLPGIDRSYRADIDGLRAAAVTMVVGYHVGLPGFSGGFIGVDVFFVISGYLIVGLLARELSVRRAIDWPAFYGRRVRRLLPAQLLMIAVVLLASRLLLFPTGEVQSVAKSAIAAAGFSSNLYFWKWEPVGYFGHELGSNALLHTWSLAVEEQFYLALLPAVVATTWLARRYSWDRLSVLRSSCAVLTFGSLACAVWAAGPHESAAFYLPVTRAYEFGLGALLALVPGLPVPGRAVRWLVAVVGVAILVAATCEPVPSDGFPSYWAMLPAAATLACLWAGNGLTAPAWTLPLWRPIVGVGVLSYGWYLWHWPLLVLAASLNLAPLPLQGRVVAAVLALVVAWLSHRFWEVRFYRRRGIDTPEKSSMRFGPWRLIVVGSLCAGLVAGAAGAIGWWAKHAKWEGDWAALAAEINDTPDLPVACEDMIDPSEEPRPGACDLTPHVEGAPTVVLWGDSHAWHLIPAVQAAFADERVNLVAWVWGGCAPMAPRESIRIVRELRSSEISDEVVERADLCASHNRGALRQVRRLADTGDGVEVILSARWEPYLGQTVLSLVDQRRTPTQDSLETSRVTTAIAPLGVESAYSILRDAGVRVWVVAPTPELERSAPHCLERASWFECDVDRERVDQFQAPTREWLQKVMGARYRADLIDLTGRLCDVESCRAEQEGVINYIDDDHLSASASEKFADEFAPVLASATGIQPSGVD